MTTSEDFLFHFCSTTDSFLFHPLNPWSSIVPRSTDRITHQRGTGLVCQVAGKFGGTYQRAGVRELVSDLVLFEEAVWLNWATE
jgi:hypothetical protein